MWFSSLDLFQLYGLYSMRYYIITLCKTKLHENLSHQSLGPQRLFLTINKLSIIIIIHSIVNLTPFIYQYVSMILYTNVRMGMFVHAFLSQFGTVFLLVSKCCLTCFILIGVQYLQILFSSFMFPMQYMTVCTRPIYLSDMTSSWL